MSRRVYAQKTAASPREARASGGVARLSNVEPVTGSGLLDARSGPSLVLALQRLAGNKAVSETILGSRPVVGHAEACGVDLPDLKCSASSSPSHTKSLTFSAPVPTKKKKIAQYKSIGTLTADFTMTVDIQLATVPSGLSDCATGKLQALIDNRLLPHEKKHEERFKTEKKKHCWVGTYETTLKATDPDPDTLHGTLETNLEALLDAEIAKRKKRNDAYAVTAIDPFKVTADISSCPECAPEEDS